MLTTFWQCCISVQDRGRLRLLCQQTNKKSYRYIYGVDLAFLTLRFKQELFDGGLRVTSDRPPTRI